MLAYVVGVALGDGNLSSPNGRATRLRVSCDAKYPKLIEEMETALRFLFPKNRVSRVHRTDENCIDISVYSNSLNTWMPWEVKKGSKKVQNARVPAWIKNNLLYTKLCLKGLIQTDGCIYIDRGYRMVNFTNSTRALAEDFRDMCAVLGYKSSFADITVGKYRKYIVRVCKNSTAFIDDLNLYKA